MFNLSTFSIVCAIWKRLYIFEICLVCQKLQLFWPVLNGWSILTLFRNRHGSHIFTLTHIDVVWPMMHYAWWLQHKIYPWVSECWSKNSSSDLWQRYRMLILEISILPSFKCAYIFLDKFWFKYWNGELKCFWLKVVRSEKIWKFQFLIIFSSFLWS